MELSLDFFRHMGAIADRRTVETISCTCKSLECIARNVRELEFKPAGGATKPKRWHGTYRSPYGPFCRYRYGKDVGRCFFESDQTNARIELACSGLVVRVLYFQSRFVDLIMRFNCGVEVKITPRKIKVRAPKTADRFGVLTSEYVKIAESIYAIPESMPAADDVRDVFDRICSALIQKRIIA